MMQYRFAVTGVPDYFFTENVRASIPGIKTIGTFSKSLAVFFVFIAKNLVV